LLKKISILIEGAEPKVCLRFSNLIYMKPQHRLILRKVGKGSMFDKVKGSNGEMRTMDVKPEEMRRKFHDPSVEKITEDMEGMGLKKAKRKPLRFKL